MAANGLYITNREQTLDQLAIHDALLEEIEVYQETIEAVKTKGRSQIQRYVGEYPEIQATIEKQLKNVQVSIFKHSKIYLAIINFILIGLIRFSTSYWALDKEKVRHLLNISVVFR